jgi:hypothetical protein
VRRLEGPEPDALVGAADLGIVRVVRLCADAAVAEARAAVGRWCGARWAARSEEGGGGASDTQGMGNFSGGWAARARRLIGRAAVGAASLPHRMAQKRARKIFGARGIFACPLEVRAGSSARQTGG